MGYFALACALASLGAMALSVTGKYLAIGLGVLAIGSGIFGYRRGRSGVRLAAASGIAVGLAGAVLGGAKVGLTLVVLERLANSFR